MTCESPSAPDAAGRALLAEVTAFAARYPATRTFPVHNPADGSLLAEMPDLDAEATRAAVSAARQAFPAWARRTAAERAAVLHRWHALIVQRQEALAQLLTLEQGKPLAEARGEVLFGAGFIEWFAGEGRRLYGDIVPSHAADKRCLVLKQPVGVVGAITPWNFPSAMITRKVSPALACGCTIVVKPAEDTPLSALALALLAEQAGFPPGVFDVVPAAAPAEVAAVLTSHPDVRKISFTGSTRVGKLLMRQCADGVKRLSLELGGNAPFIVFDDADLDAAVAGLMATKFRNAGQTCVASNRVYVQAAVADAFVARLRREMAALTVGDGLAADTRIGPLINAAAVTKVAALVDDARDRGAEAVLGGAAHPCGGNFFAPTLLDRARADMRIAREEIFGPVVALYRFDSEEQVIAAANDTGYGLAAYFWSRDLGRAFRVGEALEYGMVGINEVLSSNPAVPFGGIKESGLGREGSRYGLDDFTDIKYLALGQI
ncbi:MAG: NAD-dependent succinate-semialdehyde dehydrogenase [Pseudoxanthomonas sp.]